MYMWPRMKTGLTRGMWEWWSQWEDIGKGGPQKPSESEAAKRGPWTWTMAYTSQPSRTPSWTKLRKISNNACFQIHSYFIYNISHSQANDIFFTKIEIEIKLKLNGLLFIISCHLYTYNTHTRILVWQSAQQNNNIKSTLTLTLTLTLIYIIYNSVCVFVCSRFTPKLRQE